MSASSACRAPFARLFQQTVPRQTQSRSLHTFRTRPSPLRQNLSAPRARVANQQHRNASTVQNGKALFREYPISISIAGVAILIGSCAVIYANHVYQNYIIASFHKYPEPVAVKLRRALYYTNSDLQPKEALKYYRQALQIAEEIGMDPFSDEIMGVKIQIAAMMENIQLYSKAIQVLEILRRDSLTWLEELGGLEQNKLKRTKVLQKLVGISIKLGELYSNPVIYNRDMAENRLVWAVETILKERQRRDALKVNEEAEGSWLSESEIGAAMEALAHTYEETNQHHLATPLFLQALSLSGASTCHSVVLMNNLASSLAQQSPRAAAAAQKFAQSQTISEQPAQPSITRETMITNAQTWAQKAIDVAAQIKPPVRDEECDMGCAVALHNLGEFAQMKGDLAEASKKFTEAVSLAKAVGFLEGVENGEARLKELASKK
jgi:tetratricopeptide (TPR) repeat protein